MFAIQQNRNPVQRAVCLTLAGFIGTSNLLDGRVESVTGDVAVLSYGAGERVLVPVSGAMTVGDNLEVSVRPEKIDLSREAPADAGTSVLSAVVTEVVYHGSSTNYTVKTSAGPNLVVFDQNAYSAEDLAEHGDTVYLSWSPQHSYPIGV